MNQERFKQIDSILDEVLEVSTVERERILDERCPENADLKDEVLQLLSSLDKSDDFIERSEFTPVKHFIENETDEFIGKKIGAYRLKKLLGAGGMSAVYLASRIDDFEKEVAVKIIPPFENRRKSAENFRRERQILARLEHANIAQILDGGTTEGDKPFIVMEYVDGFPLNVYCDENKLGETEKLKIFQEVCHTVSFAHQNLIVHRDLKPNNIFVTKNGKVKLLDFGIAKLLDAEGFNFTENKTFDGNALTLEYASPEQINGENITVSSDVYSLGVILYELLTEKRPHYFKNKSLSEILNIVQTKEPVAPSAISNSTFRISNSELDLIILKALCKDVSERYQTVADFSHDIQNYLENLPISVRPATPFYRFKKYIQRNRIESAVALLVSFLIIGWLITFFWQLRSEKFRARENRRAAYSAEMILAANEYENANLNRLREILEKYKPEAGETIEDLRGFEWYFLNNLLNPASKIASFHHPDEVWGAEFSPDGKYIVTACNDNLLRIWNVETGAMTKSNEQAGAWKISFFPDGKTFAAASSSNQNPIVVIYETATGAEVLTLKGHSKRIRAVDVAPDGKTIATGSQDGTIRLWDAETGAELKRFSFGTAPKNIEFYDLQFTKTGDKLAALGFETLVIFDTRTWKRKIADVTKYADKNFLLTGWKLLFSPLEQTLAVGSFEGDVAFIDVETLDIRRILNLHRSNVKSLAFSADGKTLVTGSSDRTVKFIDVQTGETLNELLGHFSGVHEVLFSPDNSKIATASADFNLNIWNAADVSRANAILTGAGNFTFSADGQKAFGWNGINTEFSAWDLTEKRKIFTAKSEVAGVFTVAYNDSRNLVALAGRNGYISILDASGEAASKMFRGSDRTIYELVFAPDGSRIYGGFEDGAIRCFDAETGAEIFAVQAFNTIVKTLAISPDGKFLAAGGNAKTVKILDAVTGAELAVLSGNLKPIYKLAFSPSGEFVASAGADDTARIWRVADQKLIQEFTGMSAGIFALAFAPDNSRLATASDVGVIRLWNLETGEQVMAFTASPKQITHLKFTLDGATLISLDANSKMRFWQTHR